MVVGNSKDEQVKSGAEENEVMTKDGGRMSIIGVHT